MEIAYLLPYWLAIVSFSISAVMGIAFGVDMVEVAKRTIIVTIIFFILGMVFKYLLLMSFYPRKKEVAKKAEDKAEEGQTKTEQEVFEMQTEAADL